MTMFVYRNNNTGDVVEYPYRSARLEMLPNWETLQEPEAESAQALPTSPPAPMEPPAPPATPELSPQEPTAPVVAEPPSPEAPGDGPVAGGVGSGPDAAPERPARSAPKADWQAYARARAQDSDEEVAIDGLTKDQLIEQYGGDN
ncbi:hypothetical protein K4B79_18675 [Streptomyces lincolnensis]|uniref:hypothetical protein n=1 Tax=Streptomyces lincolnensis TaxID=1915 RepID=UPI001E569CC0|nr:hypothetical protein [Streptomyces lincolnensis]MCD7440240.1 hypothetical protein [Streptomyces lincolnensis]